MITRHVTKTCRSFPDLDECTRDAGVAIHRGQPHVRLARRVVVADEMGRTTPRAQERIAGPIMAKKLLEVADPLVRSARLAVFVLHADDATVLTLLVNGKRLSYRFAEQRDYWHRDWTVLNIPPSLLKRGVNEFVFQTNANTPCSLLIEHSLRPQRSAKSVDGGRSWGFGNLGVTGAFRHGEYLVRLELERYAPIGTLTSPPVDLALLAGSGGVAAAGHLCRLHVAPQGKTPKGTRLRMAVRYGSTPSYDPATWTCWRPARQADRQLPTGARFVQWQAELTTALAHATPTLSAVRLTAEWALSESSSPRASRVVADRTHNPKIVRSSYHFAHQSFDEKRLALFRAKWHLDSIVDEGSTDFDNLVRIRKWLRHQWEDGWNRGPMAFVPPWDGFLILELASRQLSLGMCTHYAAAFVHTCVALGYTARIQIMRAHCIAEVWSDHWQKWVAFDVGGDTNDRTKVTYHFERHGVPLSALEVHKAWVSGRWQDLTISPASAAGVMKLADRTALFDRFCIHHRNDELSSLEPGELEHGAASYHYDEYLWWQDSRTPPLPWFSRHSSRESDFHWTLNQAEIHLQRTQEPGRLHVLLDTETPNFETFLFRTDDGQWQPCEASFEWPLHPGLNTLAARSQSRFGHKGAISTVVVRA